MCDKQCSNENASKELNQATDANYGKAAQAQAQAQAQVQETNDEDITVIGVGVGGQAAFDIESHLANLATSKPVSGGAFDIQNELLVKSGDTSTLAHAILLARKVEVISSENQFELLAEKVGEILASRRLAFKSATAPHDRTELLTYACEEIGELISIALVAHARLTQEVTGTLNPSAEAAAQILSCVGAHLTECYASAVDARVQNVLSGVADATCHVSQLEKANA